MLLQRSGEDERQVGDQRSEEERQRDRRRDVHAVLLSLSELGDQRVVRCAVHRHKQIEQDQEDQHPDDIDLADMADRRAEDEHRDQRERDGRDSHKRDPASVRVFAPVGERGDQRIRHRVKDTADEGDQSQNRQDPPDDQARRDIKLRARLHRLRRRQVKCHKPRVDNAAQNRPAQLSDGKCPHFLLSQSSRSHSCPLLWNLF